ncbi:MAG: TonB-dependent receptor [Bernardetiaceae bacterium]|nr:TonB-dependent receptor [Bernardetiaceae bacterium]
MLSLRLFFLLPFFLFFGLFSDFQSLQAQRSIQVQGRVLDASDNSPLVGANVLLLNMRDSSRQGLAITDENGLFGFSDLRRGDYIIQISYIAYQTQLLKLEARNATVLADIKLKPTTQDLAEINIEEKLPIAIQKGDTTSFNADAFKTQQNASAQDLLEKMPGVVVENGEVKAQGETVQKVFVDGKPFFGDDPRLALQNLPAEVIDKIEIFDGQSEQSQFTGYDDGETKKSINIVTKKDMRNGQFGKVYAGYSPTGEYIAGGNLNFFNGDRRISIIGLSNNINQQNFSGEDLLGAVGGGGGRGRGGRGRGGRGRGGFNAGGNANDFLVGQQNGINTTHSFGVNYSDSWGEKTQVNASYFFNAKGNQNREFINREYFLEADSSQFYDENNISESQNFNHRLNFRMEHKFSRNTSLIFTPTLSLQQNEATQSQDLRNFLGREAIALNEGENLLNSLGNGLNTNNNLLLRHRFGKRGRSLSLNLGGGYQHNYSEGSLLANNIFYEAENIRRDSINQTNEILNTGYNLSANLVYTEPLGEGGNLQFSYRTRYNQNDADRQINNFDPFEQRYSRLDSLLSNTFENRYLTNSLGTGYRLRKGNLNLMVSTDFQVAQLSGDQVFPFEAQTNRNFYNVLPRAMLRYKISDEKNLRLFYRTSTNAPSLTQLQNVIDNSNPLLLQTGNQDLDQSYTHRFVFRYSSNNMDKASSFFAYLSASLTQNYVTNASLIARRDTVLSEGITLFQGGQLIRPVNLDGNHSLNAFYAYGKPIKMLKSNLNFNGGLSYNRLPGLINEQLNFSNNYNLSQGITLSSNISERVDFTVSYRASYNIVRNSLQSQLNNDFFSQATNAKGIWIFGKVFLLEANATHQLFRGLSQEFNQSFMLLTLSAGKKIFKNERGEIKATVFDVLNQNNNIARNVSEIYVEDIRSLVLNRYAMLVFTYNIRHFIKK